MENKSLYIIGQEFLAIEEQLIENEGELTPELEQALTLNKEELATKGHNYIVLIKRLEWEAENAQKEAKRIAEYAKHRQNSANRLRENIFNTMTSFNIEKIEMPGFTTLSLRKNPASVVVEIDAKELPAEYRREVTTVSADKEKIKEALKAGKIIPGTRLEEDKKSLSIK